ncbi:hypothetical protein EYF80_050054 [Liparis tanakae]|uniref:Uncharacterized protein n=1 Tax=Liparis tanakae TaxID=230148 RepID=A0A4Z2FFV5_9TELE|nr:hypothetical protein EYF80_050054 [Liparis tanakae]
MVIMPSMSPPSSGTAASMTGGLESEALLTMTPPATPPSIPSPSPTRASLALRFFSERSLPMGPGLYSFVSTGSILLSETISISAGTPSLSVLPADDGAPN